MGENLAHAMAAEIRRVSAVEQRLKTAAATDFLSGIEAAPMLDLLDRMLTAAVAAIGDGDVVELLRVYWALKAVEE